MNRDDEALAAFERLVQALSADILATGKAEILASHAGRAGRVAADSLRQAIRRGAAPTDDDPAAGRDLARRPIPPLPS